MKKLVSFALCLLLGAAFLLCGCDKQGELRHVSTILVLIVYRVVVR